MVQAPCAGGSEGLLPRQLPPWEVCGCPCPSSSWAASPCLAAYLSSSSCRRPWAGELLENNFRKEMESKYKMNLLFCQHTKTKVFCCSKLPDTMEEALNLGKKKSTEEAEGANRANQANQGNQANQANRANQGIVNKAMEEEEQGVVNRAMGGVEEPES